MKLLKLIIFLFSITELFAQSNCDCREYIYLNDTQEESVHKWLVVGDTVQEVLAANGGPWLQNIIDPHGIGADINGFIYVGDRTTDPRKLIKVSCTGDIVDDDLTDSANQEFSSLNIEIIGNTLYSYDAGGIKAWNTCTGQLLESYDPVTSACDIEGEIRDDAWGFLQAIDGSFYGTRYIETVINGEDALIFNVFQFSSDFTTWGPDCSIPLVYTDTLLNTGLERFWGLTQDPTTGNFITVGAEQGTAGRFAVIYMFDNSWNLIDTLGDYTNDNTGFAGTRGVTYSPALDKFLFATQRGDCIAAVRIDDETGELVECEPLIPFVSGSQGKGIEIVTECCPSTNLQNLNNLVCIPDINSPTYINEIYSCENRVCGEWTVDSADPNLNYEPCDQSITITGTDACATFSKEYNGTLSDGSCDSFDITMDVCFYVGLNPPQISITDSTCEPETDGAINIITPCEAGTTIEYTIDGGLTWSATPPTYSATNSITVNARCIDIDCFSTETADAITAPGVCCPAVNCIQQYGNFTFNKRIP